MTFLQELCPLPLNKDTGGLLAELINIRLAYSLGEDAHWLGNHPLALDLKDSMFKIE